MWYKIPERFHAIDMHNHIWMDLKTGKLNTDLLRNLLKGADQLGIERIGISLPLLAPRVTPEEFRHANDLVLEVVSGNPRFFGFAFVDPYFADESAEEIRRCVKLGMKGVKLYHQYTICDDMQRPVAETAADLGVPVLIHAGKMRDHATSSIQPNLSNACHFLEALKKYPRTTFIQAHIGGGGDWEWNLRVLRNLRSPRYFIDLSGSVTDADIVRRTIDAVGIDSILWATDMSMEESVAKLDAAKLDEESLHKVLHLNFERIESMRKA